MTLGKNLNQKFHHITVNPAIYVTLLLIWTSLAEKKLNYYTYTICLAGIKPLCCDIFFAELLHQLNLS